MKRASRIYAEARMPDSVIETLLQRHGAPTPNRAIASIMRQKPARFCRFSLSRAL